MFFESRNRIIGYEFGGMVLTASMSVSKTEGLGSSPSAPAIIVLYKFDYYFITK